jgi:hypothetical protein
MGCAAFDLGRYGEALALLTPSPAGLEQARRREQAAWSHAYLGQLLTAMGAYDEADATLGEGAELYADPAARIGVRGYCRGLQGRVSVERDPPRLDAARAALAAGRAETAASGFRPVISLLDCYWAELLLAEGGADALTEADETLSKATSFGWARSEITACSLQARVALAQGDLDKAVRLSGCAVDELEARGWKVTAVRSEEIVHWHARILEAAHLPEAVRFRGQAAAIVNAKADSLTDPAQRERFLCNVRLTRDILAAAAG